VFEDRSDAGIALAGALEAHRGGPLLVLAIPRGGVEVGYQVAKHLGAEFSILIARKLPLPYNPEAGFGAIAEDGSTFVFHEAAARIPGPMLEAIQRRQREEIERRIQALRGGAPLPELAGRTVILVDDGIAMGSTMRAAILLCKRRSAAKIVVAAPVAGERIIRELETLVDEVVVLERPPAFRAVAQVYRNWYDVQDSEVLDILERWRLDRAEP